MDTYLLRTDLDLQVKIKKIPSELVTRTDIAYVFEK